MRKGARFEDACLDFFEELGYITVFENEEFACKKPKRHEKKSHEIDFLLRFKPGFFLKPWCSTQRVLIECKNSFKMPSNTQEIKDRAKEINQRISCVKDYGYKVNSGIIVTNSTIPQGCKLSSNVFVWDQARLNFYSYKIFAKKMERSGLFFKEKKISNHISYFGNYEKHEKQQKFLHRIWVFFDKTNTTKSAQVNISDLKSAFSFIKNDVIKNKRTPTTIYANLISLAGFTRAVFKNNGGMNNQYSTTTIKIEIEKILDVSIAPWIPLIK